ncbi:MAG: chromate efflux transporter [Alphaproteobacteria bacterium]|nr:chromate efflux transporter [Alphaproteobacteria bacterium]MBU0795783.1 chromate efflux transporter [Alphaproteobacteria bacterium]MBU0886645.1 chromate efflux transporter [Alphaproteobacteria bacterium]MBU1814500.1 chromate efflux transporter [Alphaproteobacteria bacterium]
MQRDHRGTVGEIFIAFLKLGLTSFGGPIAHLGYFRDELVIRRRWIDEKGYADLVALCQFLPGPASSQTGFALGLLRGGPMGAAAAWLAFTLPSAIALFLFALGAAHFGGPIGSGILTGLKIVAVAIIAQAVWGMAKNLCPDRPRAGIALAALLIVILVPIAFGQIAAILIGGLAGYWLCRMATEANGAVVAFPVSRRIGILSLALFFLLLVGLPLLATGTGLQGVALTDAFYRTGALVFGGGHVILPLLEAETVQTGWVERDVFLAGYGAAQAIPGPLSTFAAYLGAALGPEPNGLAGASIALVAIFLPGFLLLVGIMPFWNEFRTQSSAQSLMRGANAAVVGILGAALYDPVWTSAILEPAHFALALTGFLLLTIWKTPPWVVVILSALGGVLISLISG